MASLRVWSRFVRKNNNGSILKLRIQDSPKHLLEDVTDFYMRHFVKDEILQKASGVYKNLEAMKESRGVMHAMLKDPLLRTIVCCPDNDTDAVKDIISVYSLKLTTCDDSMSEMNDAISKIKTPEMRKYGEILNGLSSTMHDVMIKHDIKKCYDDRGGAVHHEFRNLGLSGENLRAVRLMCKEHGVPMTVAWITSLALQKAAAKNGWETVFEISFEELGRRHGVTFDDAHHNFKMMINRV